MQRSTFNLRNPGVRVAGIALPVLAGGISFVWLARPPSLDEVGRRLVSCTLSDNAPCIYRYISDHEKKVLGLDVNKVQTMLDRVVRPRLAGLRPSGPLKVQWVSSDVDVSQMMRAADGRLTNLEFVVGPGEEGPYSATVVLSLFLIAANATWPGNKPFPHSNDRAEFWGEATSRMLPDLKATGISGLIRGYPPREKTFTWEEFRDFELARGNGGPTPKL